MIPTQTAQPDAQSTKKPRKFHKLSDSPSALAVAIALLQQGTSLHTLVRSRSVCFALTSRSHYNKWYPNLRHRLLQLFYGMQANENQTFIKAWATMALPKPIAKAAHSYQILWIAGIHFHLFTQPTNMHIHSFAIANKIGTPDPL